jgi:hypothetical protein
MSKVEIKFDFYYVRGVQSDALMDEWIEIPPLA